MTNSGGGACSNDAAGSKLDPLLLPRAPRLGLPKRTLRSHKAHEIQKIFDKHEEEDSDDCSENHLNSSASDSYGQGHDGSKSNDVVAYNVKIVPAPDDDQPSEQGQSSASPTGPKPPGQSPCHMPEGDISGRPRSPHSPTSQDSAAVVQIPMRKAQSDLHKQSRGAFRLRRLVESALFDYVSGALVVCNSITIGMQTDYLATRTEADPPIGYRAVDILFCVAFTLELLCRLRVYGISFFCASDWKWNWFDLLLVSMQLVDETLTAVASGASSGMNFSFMRVLRILRLVRIMRIIRILRLIGELRAIVSSIMGSMKSLGWTLALLFLLVYIFAVYFTQVVLDYRVNLQEEMKSGNYITKNADRELEAHFGSLSRSILSLYQAITGGVDWSDLSNPLIEQVSVLVGMVLSFYIAFGVLALLNVVTGVFVEAALKSARDDKDDYMMSHVRDMLKKHDDDIDLTRFKEMLGNPQMQEFFKAIDVDISEADSVFHLLDADDSGTISLDEFMNGCRTLRGNAKALDLSILLHETRVFSRNVLTIGSKVLELQELMTHPGQLRKNTTAPPGA
eukprot:TRINITY_DN4353_c0_g1_i1.p1 TRINITY_DN4353_c0_g1~~TRINITY_DN4353_c0_g1_i1.p1  ORF type:complete len:654 (+),score=94.13 TRINITY_DN4353_c0_g1_i1:268-1962(+)